MMQGFSGPERVSVYFGGQADEVWTNSGLTVTYKGRLEVSAVRDGETFRAEVRPSVPTITNPPAARSLPHR